MDGGEDRSARCVAAGSSLSGRRRRQSRFSPDGDRVAARLRRHAVLLVASMSGARSRCSRIWTHWELTLRAACYGWTEGRCGDRAQLTCGGSETKAPRFWPSTRTRVTSGSCSRVTCTAPTSRIRPTRALACAYFRGPDRTGRGQLDDRDPHERRRRSQRGGDGDVPGRVRHRHRHLRRCRAHGLRCLPVQRRERLPCPGSLPRTSRTERNRRRSIWTAGSGAWISRPTVSGWRSRTLSRTRVLGPHGRSRQRRIQSFDEEWSDAWMVGPDRRRAGQVRHGYRRHNRLAVADVETGEMRPVYP